MKPRRGPVTEQKVGGGQDLIPGFLDRAGITEGLRPSLKKDRGTIGLPIGYRPLFSDQMEKKISSSFPVVKVNEDDLLPCA